MLERRTFLRTASTVGLAAVLAGCGSSDATPTPDGDEDGGDGSDGNDDGGDGGGTPTPTETDTESNGPAETTESTGNEATETPGTGTDAGGQSAREVYPDYNWDRLDGESAQDASTVTITGFEYDPIVARVPAGEEIAFPNEDQAPHTVTIPAAGIDAEVGGGGETTITIDEPGTYDYVCRFHSPDMLGRLVVE